ncbi:MAG: tetratricopeptide repeat protein [Spirochaetes bacterium]|nr:tetratricopeptide repeat protein [Spirochaetota bacterium]
MRLKTVITGIILIVLGIGIFVYYDFYIKPDKAAKVLLVEGKFVYERGDKTSINSAIDIFARIIANYPDSKYVPDAYYHIARSYEKLGLHRLAYLKYIYLIKNNNRKLDSELRREILVRLAHINVLKQYSEEAVSQLYSLLNSNFNKEFRSRIYSELGHTYLKQKEYQKAKRMFDIALTEHGSNEDAIIGQARALKWTGRDNDAYDLYESFLKYYGAVSQYTQDVKKAYKEQAYYSGLNAFRNRNYGAAVSFFNRVLTNFSGDRISENALYWIGESYYAMGEFDKAISFFNKTLINGFYHKDEDARIKKGYAYFTSKRFDLAAREFQLYLHHYSRGKYAPVAKNWKEMSTKELLFRIQNKQLPDASETMSAKEEEFRAAPKKQIQKKFDDELEEDLESDIDEEISGEYYIDTLKDNGIEVENVAEL